MRPSHPSRVLPILLLAGSCAEPVLSESNDPPLAVIRAPADGELYDEGEPVDLQGEVTDDKGVGQLTVEWLDNGTPLGTGEAEVDEEGNTALTVADLTLGPHAISLRVVDGDNLSFEASVGIEIIEAIVNPTLDIIRPESGERGEAGTSFSFEVEVSDPNSPPTDLDVDVESDLDGFLCAFDVDADGLGLCSAAPVSDGDHRLTFNATDPEGNTRSRTLSWTVDAVAEAPTLRIIAPAGGSLRQNQTTTFEAEVSDRQDPPTSLAITVTSDVDGLICEPVSDAAGTATCAGALQTPGTQRLTFEVTDTDDNTTSRQVLVQVTDGDDIDDDGDGYSENQGDCDDSPTGGQIYPGAPERPNGQDDNCDDVADEGTVRFDDDGDGFCEGPVCTDGTTPGDCNDDPATGGGVNPGAAEVCGNPVDEDCDNTTDEDDAQGCSSFFADADGDTYGDPDTPVCACANRTGIVTNDRDCDDTTGDFAPGVPEVPDGEDQDCDDVIDEGTVRFDDDGDGFCEGPVCSDGSTPGDCNDDPATGAAINPGAPEVCSNGIDDNCLAGIDEDGATGCSSFFADADGDTYGDPDTPVCACANRTGIVTNDRDCDDTTGDFAPGVPEVPDGEDQDCDDVIDEGTVRFDDDGDGFCEGPVCSDGSTPGDCNDDPATGAAINPGAPEVCSNGIDDNCLAGIDEDGATGCSSFFADADGDTYGDPDTPVCACANRTGIVTNDRDCDDTTGDFAPGVPEVPDGEDQDCDDVIDEGTVRFDDDGDGFCEGPVCSDGSTPGDCNDDPATGAAVNPGAPEVCSNGIDDNCASGIDEDGATGCSSFFADADGDTYGDPDTPVCACANRDGIVTNDRDCDDTTEDFAPGVPEVPDGEDQDCDDVIDEGTVRFDDDGDGFCEGPVCSDGSTPGDCNDDPATGAAVNPGAPEVCSNGIDDNCASGQNEDGALGCTDYFADRDADGFGNPDDSRCSCSAPGGVFVLDNRDCDDSSLGGSINPNATEQPNGIDDNCNSVADEGTIRFDDDGDGFCEGPTCTDGTTPGDCDDTSPNAGLYNPGVKEVCGNLIDEDCSGTFDDGLDDEITGGTTFYRDADSDGFGRTAGATRDYCLPTGVWTATSGTDCYDDNSLAYPGPRQSGDPLWYVDNRGDGSFDYNCNNIEDERFTDNEFECGCTVQGAGISVPIFQFEPGWDGVPACGQSGDYVTACQQTVVDLGITDPVAALFFGLVQCFAGISELDIATIQSRTQECR